MKTGEVAKEKEFFSPWKVSQKNHVSLTKKLCLTPDLVEKPNGEDTW